MVGHAVIVGLVQVNNSFSGQNYLPYSVACLRSYVERYAKDSSRYRFVPFVYKRMPVRDIVESLSGTDVAGFSTYVWNANISLEAARRLKEKQPQTLIVFGGPQVPSAAEDFLRTHPFIDVVVHNEGEQTFLNILEAFPDGDWRDVRGISYLDDGGAFVSSAAQGRMRELDDLPSPFLAGVFDDLMDRHPDEQWIGLWETNRGCPFKCTFCDWGSATASKVTRFTLDRLKAEAEWFAENRIEYIFCCDANFGMLKRDIEIAQYVRDLKHRSGYPKALSVQNTKNATDRAFETQKILADGGLNKGVALSMQSLDEKTLVNIKRDNISLDSYLELQHRFGAHGVETYSDLILGLPGETYESFVRGVSRLVDTGQHGRIQFNNLSVLPNAEMGDAEYMATFGMKTVVSEIINIHGARDRLDDDIVETQHLVVETASMPASDWRRVRSFCWMSAFLYFDKLLQIPIMVARHFSGMAFHELVNRFMSADASEYPLIAEIREFFLAEAASIQSGGPEYVYSAEWLGIFWPADEYAFIRLTAEGRMDAFFDEAQRLLRSEFQDLPPAHGACLADAFTLNRELVSRPFVDTDCRVEMSHDILGFWRAILEGQPPSTTKQPTTVIVNRADRAYRNFDDWCREVVWWGNKAGAYLYSAEIRRPEPMLAGHF